MRHTMNMTERAARAEALADRLAECLRMLRREYPCPRASLKSPAFTRNRAHAYAWAAECAWEDHKADLATLAQEVKA